MSDVTQSGKPLGRAPEAAAQIERAVRFIIRSTGARSVDIIAHSWGTIPAGLFAGKHPGLVRRLVLFGPIGVRNGSPAETAPAWELVTVAQQHARFVRAVPLGEPGVLLEKYFPAWAVPILIPIRKAEPARHTPSRSPGDLRLTSRRPGEGDFPILPKIFARKQ
ncbi:alpha/beta fold hydrolase [Sphingopyxis kveilinensis]|uniref:alpha/beta fold hydrolase n=1 Tax=Sphingopyxis kveilinensis TaxID=3114367 RepID=UPI003BB1182B